MIKENLLTNQNLKQNKETQEAGNIAYINDGVPFKECKLSFSDYLDY
jgi:hypothetical protein